MTELALGKLADMELLCAATVTQSAHGSTPKEPVKGPDEDDVIFQEAEVDVQVAASSREFDSVDGADGFDEDVDDKAGVLSA